MKPKKTKKYHQLMSCAHDILNNLHFLKLDFEHPSTIPEYQEIEKHERSIVASIENFQKGDIDVHDLSLAMNRLMLDVMKIYIKFNEKGP